MKPKHIFLLLLTCITAISAIVAIHIKEGAISYDTPYFAPQGHSPDAFEYHTLAANLALHDCFPYYGFMSSMSDYRLCEHPDSVAYYRDTRGAGPIVFDNKPPLYPLALGLTYKVFGFRPATAAYFNLLCIIFTISLMPVAGYLMNDRWGAMGGLVGAVVFMYLRTFKVWYFTPENFATLLVMVVLCAGILASRKNTVGRYAWLGISISLLALCKGMFLGTLVLMSGYLLYRVIVHRQTRYLTALIAMSLSACLVVLLWMAYINPLVRSNQLQRDAFYRSLKATAPKVMYDTYKDLFDSTGQARSEAKESLNKFHQYDHVSSSSLVVITSQMKNYDILNEHNEYCTDGDFHPEWLLIRSSFYNKHANLSQGQKVLLFYRENPALVIGIAWAKVKAISGWRGYLFYLSILCSVLSAIYAQNGQRWVAGTALLLNILTVQVLIYADTRFIDSVAPVSVLMVTLSLASITRAVRERRTRNWYI